jgi:hypothetical protein
MAEPPRFLDIGDNTPNSRGADIPTAAEPVNNLDQRSLSCPIGAHYDIGADELAFLHDAFLWLNLRK